MHSIKLKGNKMFGEISIISSVIIIIGASSFFLIASFVGVFSDGFLSESKIG